MVCHFVRIHILDTGTGLTGFVAEQSKIYEICRFRISESLAARPRFAEK